MSYVKFDTKKKEVEIVLHKGMKESDIIDIIECMKNVKAAKINCKNIQKVDTPIMGILARLCLFFTKKKSKIKFTQTTKELKEHLNSIRLDYDY